LFERKRKKGKYDEKPNAEGRKKKFWGYRRVGVLYIGE
jgi:hypothetical protein